MNIYIHSQLAFLPCCAIYAYCTRNVGSDKLIILAYARAIWLRVEQDRRTPDELKVEWGRSVFGAGRKISSGRWYESHILLLTDVKVRYLGVWQRRDFYRGKGMEWSWRLRKKCLDICHWSLKTLICHHFVDSVKQKTRLSTIWFLNAVKVSKAWTHRHDKVSWEMNERKKKSQATIKQDGIDSANY